MALFQYTIFLSIWISIQWVRRSSDGLIFITGIPTRMLLRHINLDTTPKKFSTANKIPANHYSRYLLHNHVMHYKIDKNMMNMPLNFICWHHILNALNVNIWTYSKCQNATHRLHSQLTLIYIYIYVYIYIYTCIYPIKQSTKMWAYVPHVPYNTLWWIQCTFYK